MQPRLVRFLPSVFDYNPGEEPLRDRFKRLYYGIKTSKSVAAKTRVWTTKDKTEVNIVIMNLIAAVGKGKNLSYSRSTKHKPNKRYNRKNIDNRKILRAIDFLELHSYCINNKAPANQDPRKERMFSFIQPTQKFIDEFCSEDEAILFAEQQHACANEVIILRDVEGNDIDYKDNNITEEARDLVIKLNTISYNSVFRKRDGSLMDNLVVRIFSLGDFTLGGRYARSDYQNMSNKEDDRLFTTIDGEEVVEVDFSNLHIRMLTDLRGIDHSKFKDDDLYHMPLSDDDLNRDNRWLIKQAVNIMFNTSSERAAMSAIQDKIRSRPGEYCFKGPKEVLTAIKAAYPWLADDFCQPIPRGHYLMNMDSWIAHDVGKVFVELNSPIGIIHDSFIVKAKYRDNLVEAMVKAYRKRVNREDVAVHMKMMWAETNEYTGDNVYEQVIVVRD